MVKKMVLVARRDGLDAEGFAAHWRNNHAPLAAGVIGKYLGSGPGGARYVQNRVLSTLWETAMEGRPYRTDGIASFDVNPADPPPEARASGDLDVVLADEKRFIGIWTQCVVEREGADSDPQQRHTKLLVVADRNPMASTEDFRSAVRTLWNGRVGVRNVCINWVTQVMHRNGLDSEPFPPDCLVEVWLDHANAIDAVVAHAQNLRRVCRRATVFLVEEHPVI